MNKTLLGLSLVMNIVLFGALKIARERNQAFKQQIITTDKRNEQLNPRGDFNAH